MTRNVEETAIDDWTSYFMPESAQARPVSISADPKVIRGLLGDGACE